MHLISGCLALLFAADPSTGEGDLRIEGALVSIIERADVPARDAGVLTKITAQEGRSVAAGELLANIEDDEARLALEKAEAEASIARTEAENDVDVRYAKKAAEVAQSELRRARESVDRFERSISKTEMDKLVLEADRCTLAVEQAEHEIEIAKQTLHLKQTEVAAAKQVLDRRRIVSPLAGIVVEVQRQRGEWVKPGETVLRLVRTDRLRIEAFVPAGQLTASGIDRAVSFHCDALGPKSPTYRGKLTFISPEVDPVSGQVRIWAEVDNHDQSLRPGLRGTLTLVPN